MCVTVYLCVLFGDVIWERKTMKSSEKLKSLRQYGNEYQVLIPYKRPHSFYSPAAHITSITTFHSSRPSFPHISLSSHPLSFSPSHLRSFPTLLQHSVLFPNQSNEMDLYWGDFHSKQRGGCYYCIMRRDDEQNEKQEEKVSWETNQRDTAAWLTFISSSSRIYSSLLKVKYTLEYSYTVKSHQSVVFSGLQQFVCHEVLTFLLVLIVYI